MKKIKVYSLVLLGAIFGLTSCDLPDFLYKIPGVSSLLPAKEDQKEEKNDSEEKPSGEDQQGQDQGGEQGGESHGGGGQQGGGEASEEGR